MSRELSMLDFKEIKNSSVIPVLCIARMKKPNARRLNLINFNTMINVYKCISMVKYPLAEVSQSALHTSEYYVEK